jgi:hypothetical protein
MLISLSFLRGITIDYFHQETIDPSPVEHPEKKFTKYTHISFFEYQGAISTLKDMAYLIQN